MKTKNQRKRERVRERVCLGKDRQSQRPSNDLKNCIHLFGSWVWGYEKEEEDYDYYIYLFIYY